MNNNFFEFKNTLITFENSLKLMIVPMLIFIILGCLMGFLLFSSNKKSGLKWAFIQTYGSLLGAHDVIISKSNPNNNINFIVSILILIISFFFIIYLTARLTAFQIKNNYYEEYIYTIIINLHDFTIM